MHFAAIAQGQAGLLHKHTKVYEASAPQAAGSQPMSACADKLITWNKIWRADDLELQSLSPWMRDPACDAALHPLDEEQIRVAALSFPVATGLGADRMHPRIFANVDASTRSAVAVLLESVERSILWPAQVDLLVCAMIPKSGGGDRPVFVLPSIIRHWEKAGLPLMKDWARGMSRTYDWAAEGRSSAEAVWWQLLRAESIPDENGPEAEGLVTLLLDIVKCFDRVGLRHVWKWGIEHGMPARLLRVILVTYAMARRISVHGSYSDSVCTVTAIVPGSPSPS